MRIRIQMIDFLFIFDIRIGLTIGVLLMAGPFYMIPTDAEIQWRLRQKDTQALRDIAQIYGEELIILAFAELSDVEAAGRVLENGLLKLGKTPWLIGEGDLREQLRKFIKQECKGG